MIKYKTIFFIVSAVFLLVLVLMFVPYYKEYCRDSQHNAAMDLLCVELSQDTQYDVVQRRTELPNTVIAGSMTMMNRKLALMYTDIFNAHSYNESNGIKITLMKHIKKEEYARYWQYRFNRIMKRYHIPICLPFIKTKNGERTIEVLVWNCNESNASQLKDAINRIEGIPNTICIEVTNIENIWSSWKYWERKKVSGTF